MFFFWELHAYACIIESLKERWKSSLLVFGPFRVSFGLEKLFVGVCCVFLIVFPPLLNFCLVRGHVLMISRCFSSFCQNEAIAAGDMARSAGGTIVQTSIQVYPSTFELGETFQEERPVAGSPILEFYLSNAGNFACF